jgi:lipopolysaccharide export system ATP-binding protein
MKATTWHLQAKGLRKSYSKKPVLENVDFEVQRGEVVGLIGPNGAGKTTAFYIAIGLIQPDAGSIFFEGQEITSLPAHERARLGMGYLAQEPSVFRQLTVEENLLCLLQTLPLTPQQMQQRLKQLLGELHLEPLAKKKAAALSGGERRRLEITRALITSPSLLLLDEPFANVDPLTIQDVQTIIEHLCAKGISILITDHNARELFKIAHRCYLISQGHTLASGSPQELVSNQLVRERYLGKDFNL